MLCIYDLLFRYFAEKHCNHNRLWATRLRHRGTTTGVVLRGDVTLLKKNNIKSIYNPR